MKIRTAELSDISRLLEFEQAIIEAERPFEKNMKGEPFSYYDIGALIKSENSEVLVAELDGNLVASGYAKIAPSKHYVKDDYHAYLGFMYVDPAERGKNIIQLIIDGLISWSKQQGVSVIRLEVFENNSAAINAYKKVGFYKNLVEMKMNLREN